MQQTIPFGDLGLDVRRLANGLTVLLEPLPYLRSVTAGLWIQAGSACERERQGGISHLLEHLFFKGTESRTARQLVEAVERYGGQLNGFTSRDYTCLYAKTLDTHAATGLEILADIALRSRFCDFDKERNVVLEEIASVEDVPEEYAHDLFALRLWPDHALGRPVTGTDESVSAITLDDVRAFYDTWYRAGNMILAVVGSFEPDAVFERIEAEFGPLPAGPAVAPGDAPEFQPPRFGAGSEAVHRDIAQTHLCLGFPGPTPTEPRRYVYDVLNSALGGGATSRLFDRIRESEGLAYSIYSMISCYRRSGYLGMYAAMAPENLERAAGLAFDEMRRFCDEPMAADELALNREQLKGGLLMSLERTFNRMVRLAKSMMYHGRIVPIEEVVAGIDAVTEAEVQQLACEAFTAEGCALVTLGPGAPLEIAL
ncbi:MAG: insulinase family protein [Candidatus Hydrogenedentes bacterium]|nr:insulinase family protein [Candidatus Hydrogenedentota bacterium]